MKKSTFSILLLIICLFITSCTAPVTENNTAADTTAAEETIVFEAAEGEVTAIETAVLFKEPKLGSGFAGFIRKGEVAGIKAINTDEGWVIIRYCDGEYYCISSAFTSNENGENLEEGGADDLITGETIEVVLPEETTAENSSESAGSQNTGSEATTETSLEGSTSEETQGSTKPSGTTTTKPSSSSGSTSAKTTEAATKAQPTTAAPKSTTAAPKPTQAPVQPTTTAPKPTQAPVQPTTTAPKPTEAPGCNHNWIPNYVAQTVTEQVWVVDQAAGEYPVYEWRTFCNGCGEDITENVDHVYGCEGSYHDDYIQVGTEYHDEVGHYETETKTQYVADGYICTKCGEKK